MKIWNFLLPETGSHEVRAMNLGMADQTVYIDGMLLEAPEGTTLFTGPCGSLLELRLYSGNWQLLVNGFIVEDYTPGKRRSADDTLRDLKSRPDGSYTIATQFSADSLALNTVRKFRFTARGELHEVDIAHQDWVWQIVHNGRLLDRRSHSMWENTGSCRFQVDATPIKIDVEVLMSWDTIKMIWLYSLLVNHMAVPPYWTKVRGEIPAVQIPEVVGDCATAFVEHIEPVPVEPEPPRVPFELPQGVSYDSASGSFQANIRQNNKFLFLGEFRTVEDAHARYLEEAEKIRQRAAGN